MTYAVVRWLGYLAAFGVIGATVFRFWVVPRIAGAGPEPIQALAGRIVLAGRIASVVLALTLLGKLYLQSRSMIEPDEPLSPEIMRLVIASGWGKGWLVQAIAALAAISGWRALTKPTRVRPAALLVALSAFGLILAVPLTGHAIGLPAAGRLGYPMTVLHAGGGAIWLGTLGVMLVIVLRQPEPAVPLGPLVRAFSTVALPAGIVTILCGLVVAWRYVGGLDALLTTDYGNVLLVKIAALTGIAAAGAYNWRIVLPRLEIGQPAPISRSATLETAVGLVLLAATAVLVSLPAPAEALP